MLFPNVGVDSGYIAAQLRKQIQNERHALFIQREQEGKPFCHCCLKLVHFGRDPTDESQGDDIRGVSSEGDIPDLCFGCHRAAVNPKKKI